MTVDRLPEPDDAWFESQVGRLDADAAEPEAAALAGIRSLLADGATPRDRETPDAMTGVSVRIETDSRSASMLTVATRLALAATAVAVTVAFWFAGGTPNVEAAPTLGEVLKETVKAEALKLQLERDAGLATVWLSREGRVRWEQSAGRYVIADGSSLWQIDEEANTVRGADAGPDGIESATQLDLLGMLGLSDEGRASLNNARPVGTATHLGRRCEVYRKRMKLQDQLVILEAFTDRDSHQLQTLAVWPDGPRPGDAPPLAELRLVALNAAVAESTFEVSKSLTEDGRIGKVTDLQGIVSLRPMMRRRWTPICRQMVVRTKDTLRTDVRGANAITVALTSGVRVIVGPGSFVEFNRPNEATLHYGEIQIRRGKNADGEFQLTGPGAEDPQVETIRKPARTLYRAARDGRLDRIKRKPVWLGAYEGSTNNESIGSLIASINDTNVPLTVGYHKVNIEIRDQIARTTIEESFVNHTDRRLEGVFHFPLPQDASISGFGMWIGGELIEADIVEKQRAREIYETILREKRDPGLLEWTGGNVFKARVFPIEANSEKRIKIVYTQVLPLRANRYRYSYGLRSEMLQTTPLRDLSINVLVNSALPLKSVCCLTHQVVADTTPHSASLEFSRQEYTPTHDFELVCEVDGRQSDVVMIPHRRGDDGYFMAQLTPPAPDGNWQRELLPDGDPLELLLVCDTSGSMDSASRKAQAAFVTSVLSSLDEKDRFNIAVCDVDTHWLFDEPVSVGEEKSGEAHDWLRDRVSLGWTDLDRTFESIAERAGENSHVIYIGDGIVTARDADPQAFVNRLRRLYGEQSNGTFHAVSTGSRFESVVLRAIAGIGRGSTRQIGGEQTPQVIALELLNEIAQPGLADLKVEFRGLQVAAVYPDRLPNLAAGAQQILIGRFLPQGDDQRGEIIITGKRGDEEIRFAARVSVKDAESGNSFIPRLWARAHLDQLLQQGRSEVIQNEIIALSEEFHIMTPYTSLLVLETDADRERFGVKRRYQMRDGERFFADGRDNARYELMQQQMRRAGDWRIALRRRMLVQLARLARPAQLAQAIEQQSYRGFPFRGVATKTVEDETVSLPAIAASSEAEGEPAAGAAGVNFEEGREATGITYDTESELNKLEKTLEEEGQMLGGDDGAMEPGFDAAERWMPDDRGRNARGTGIADGRSFEGAGEFVMGRMAETGEAAATAILGKHVQIGQAGAGYGGGGRRIRMDYLRWVDDLFPTLPAAPRVPDVKPADPENWSDEALALSKSLLRVGLLRKLEGGLDLRRNSESFDPVWERTTARSSIRELYSPERWLTRPAHAGSRTNVNWCDEKQRGVYSKTFQLGRVRASKPIELDVAHLGIGLENYTIRPLHQSYRIYSARVEKIDDTTSRLILTYGSIPDQKNERRLTIDTQKNVIVQSETYYREKLTRTIVWSDFKQVAGAWWAQTEERLNDKGQVTHRTTQTIRQLSNAAFGKAVDNELADLANVALIHLPVSNVRESEAAVAEGSAGFEEHLLLLLRDASIQKWDSVFEHLAAMEAAADGKPGLRWVRMTLQNFARRREQLRQAMLKEASQLAKNDEEDHARAQHLIQYFRSALASNEQLELLDRLEPVYERQPAVLEAKRYYRDLRANLLYNMGRREESLLLRRQIAELAPWAPYPNGQYARELARLGDYEAAYAWLDDYLKKYDDRFPQPNAHIRQMYCDLLAEQGRTQDLAAYLKKWVGLRPEQGDPYSRYLSALVFADRPDEANELALRWMTDGRIEGPLEAVPSAKLVAAIQFALGNGYQIYQRVLEPRWRKPLTDTARFFIRHETKFSMTRQIMEARQFRDTDESDVLRKEMLQLVQEEADSLPAERIDAFVGWVQYGRRKVPAEIWKAIADSLRERWAATEEIDQKTLLGNAVSGIYRIHFADSAYLPFLRERIAQATDRYRLQFTQNLFNVLLQRDWKAEEEAEAFALLDKLSGAKTDAQKLTNQVPSLLRLVDRMLKSRYQAASRTLQDEGHPEKLSRTELRDKHASFRREAQMALSNRLRDEAARRQGTPLAPWLTIERVWLDVQLDRRPGKAMKDCWTALGDAPVLPDANDDADDDARQPAPAPATPAEQYFANLLRRRSLMTLGHLAARTSAKQDSRERLLSYVQKGATAKHQMTAAYCKAVRFMLLVAFDDAQTLERDLREWVRNDRFVTSWQRALAYLLAEQGKIAEAVSLFEVIEKNSQLTASDYTTLANWYLITDQRENYEKAQVDVFRSLQEYRISRWIRDRVRRWRRSTDPMPDEMDERVLFAFEALFEKASSPGNYLGRLNEFYTATRDFRLLRMIPDSIIGRTPQQVYSFLNSLRSGVLAELRKESTADEILKRLAEVRGEAKSAIDQRALDLLEAMVERKSAELLNQPGPHVNAAVAALKRAFERDWAIGERRQMAEFLTSLGNISQPALAAEQLRQMRELYQQAEAGSEDRLRIGWSFSRLEFYSYEKRRQAVARMEALVREYDQANPDGWPAHANFVLGGYVSLLESSRRHAEGETVLKRFLEKPANAGQESWLRERMVDLYASAIEAQSRVSLGEGDELLSNVVEHVMKRVENGDQNLRYQLLYRLIRIFQGTQAKKLKSCPREVRRFAFEALPEVLETQTRNYRRLVERTDGVVEEVIGPREALAFLLDRIESWPGRLEYSYDNAWRRFGSRLGTLRQRTGDLKELEPRLLKLVVAALRRDLTTLYAQSRSVYYWNSTFWEQKADVFLQVAEEILAEHDDSERFVMHIAYYVYHGLRQYDRAIEILLTAHQKKLLGPQSRTTLVSWLHEQQEFGQSIALLETLIEEQPELMTHRVRLMTAYHRTDQPRRLRTLLDQIDDFFRQKGRWTERNISALMIGCESAGLNEDVIKYAGELIPLHQRTRRNRGIGSSVLYDYYRHKALAHSALGQTTEAVDAAAGAVVSWGPRHDQRGQAIEALTTIIGKARDLDGYVAQRDRATGRSRRDSPVIRLAIARAYMEKGQLDKAIVQLKITVELQPTNREAHQALLECFSNLEDTQAAVKQLLAMIDFDRHNLALYNDLAARVKDDESMAERAATAIVEAAPAEAEHHTSLAKLREGQQRWDAAILHWNHAAELRALEPDGLFGLVEAQIKAKRWKEAERTLARLARKEWPSRFGDVTSRIRELRSTVERQLRD